MRMLAGVALSTRFGLRRSPGALDPLAEPVPGCDALPNPGAAADGADRFGAITLQTMKRLVSILSLFTALSQLEAADKKIVMIAGSPSHGVMEHEYRAGSL